MSVLARPKWVLPIVVVVAATSVAACSNAPSDIDWPDSTVAPRGVPTGSSATFGPAEAAAVAEILALVQGFREVEVTSYAAPEPPGIARQELAGYLADPALSETLQTLHGMEQAGVVFEGRPTWDPNVTDLRLSDTPPTATVHDCVDATNWRSVFRDTGDPVPGDSRPERYLARLQVKRYPEGWLIHDIDLEEGQC